MDKGQEIECGKALKAFRELIASDQGRDDLATHPEQTMRAHDVNWDLLPDALKTFLKHLTKPELGQMHGVDASFSAAGLLVDQPPAVDSSTGYATLCKF